MPCTGCQYCMPCPSGVNIPANFSIYNDYCMFGDETRSRGMYAMMLMGALTGKRADASLCKDCKKCMERCPQHIAIPEQLKLVCNDLGGQNRGDTYYEKKRAAAEASEICIITLI